MAITFKTFVLQEKVDAALRTPLFWMHPNFVPVEKAIGRKCAPHHICQMAWELVDQIHSLPADKLHAAPITLPEPTDVDVSLLIPTQYALDAHNLNTVDAAQEQTTLSAVKVMLYQGQYYILDGHHRVATAVAQQRQKMLAHVLHVK
jgi:hypothetical protein